jgi:hypothetical protein
MPNRANSLVPALFAGSLFASSLATTALLGVNVTASEAAECLESPHGTAEPGHWYYHSERAQNRRCWFFQPAEARSAEAMANPQTAPVQAAPNDGTPPSLLSQLTAGFSQHAPSPPQQSAPQQNNIPNDPGEVAKTASPKATKVSRRQRLQDTPAPATNGAASSAASAEQHDQSQQPAEAKGEKPQQQPVDVVERETLFQDFMKWQQERAVFGTRWP